MALIVALVSGCAGPPPSAHTIPATTRGASDAQQPSASPQSTTSAQPSAPGQYVKTVAPPAFPTTLTSGPVTRNAQGYQSQTDSGNTHVNVFDASGNFQGQVDSAQTGANDQPIVRITDPNNHQAQLNLPDIAGLPENTATSS